MNKGRFKKGSKPWNAGKKGLHLSPSTEIKPGQWVGENHPSYVDGIQRMTNDCTYVRTGNNERARRPRLVYEKKHGKIPTGYVIWHIDGIKDNDEVSNLELITRAEMLKRNRLKNL